MYGKCEICKQPIEVWDNILFVKKVEDDEPIRTHRKCGNDYLKEE